MPTPDINYEFLKNHNYLFNFFLLVEHKQTYIFTSNVHFAAPLHLLAMEVKTCPT
jgi:hypothetical protein